MKTLYILILVLEVNEFPTSISQQEYLSKESCERVKAKMESQYVKQSPYKISGMCEKK